MHLWKVKLGEFYRILGNVQNNDEITVAAPEEVEKVRNLHQRMEKLQSLEKPKNSLYECKDCHKKYKYKHDLKIHSEKHKDESQWNYECTKCKPFPSPLGHNKFYRKQTFQKHEKSWKLGLEELVHGDKDEKDLTEEEKKQREKHKKLLAKAEDKQIEKEAIENAREKEIKEEGREEGKEEGKGESKWG